MSHISYDLKQFSNYIYKLPNAIFIEIFYYDSKKPLEFSIYFNNPYITHLNFKREKLILLIRELVKLKYYGFYKTEYKIKKEICIFDKDCHEYMTKVKEEILRKINPYQNTFEDIFKKIDYENL